MALLGLAFLAIAILPDLCLAMDMLVDAPAGRLQGAVEETEGGGSIVAFRGIPYAKPPVEELRFAKPQPLPRMDKVFQATKNATECVWPAMYRAMLNMSQGGEDCLQLNVYAKDIRPDAKRKVLVFIHGGGYVVGSSITVHMGSLVANHDLVTVSINYRLGVLGFLSTGDENAPGNWGLWDMTLALQWVKDNIASFGGDPTDVTISGESAGGSAVGFLSITPKTKGLFTRAWPMSGAPSSSFGKAFNPKTSSMTLAKKLGCFDGEVSEALDAATTKAALDCMRQLPSDSFAAEPGLSLDNVQFVPTVDNDFIPGPVASLLADDDYLTKVGFFDRAYLIGMDNNENSVGQGFVAGSVAYLRSMENKTEEEKESMVSALLQASNSFYVKSYFDGAKVPESVVDKVVDWYDRRYSDLSSMVNLYGDLGFLVPIMEFAAAAARGPNTNVWLLHFNHYPKYMAGKQKGIIHGLDLIYWLDISIVDINSFLQAEMNLDIGFLSEDTLLKAQLQNLVADFTKKGSLSESVPGVQWPLFDNKNAAYLDFKPESEIRQGELGLDTLKLWREKVPRWYKEALPSNARDEL